MGEELPNGFAYVKRKKTGGRQKGTKNRPKLENLEPIPHHNAGYTTLGNRTKGAERRGNHAGRPPIYTDDTPTRQVLITLSNFELAVLLYVGEGKVSKGVRRIAAAMRTLIDCPDNVADVKEQCRNARIHLNESIREQFKGQFDIEIPKLSLSGAGRPKYPDDDGGEEQAMRKALELCYGKDYDKEEKETEPSEPKDVDPLWDDCFK